ncbi:MAG: HAD family hydrolase [Anaerolineales bacterium]|nr:HAD family hydrolase [Anaerolineales bacterium]MCK5633602.1 HAD family hydrolase [Anaerolineales bacterium]
MMTIKALIFDFDGLILDTETALFRSWDEIFTEYGVSVSLFEWASLLGTSTDLPAAYEMIEEHIGGPVDRESIRAHRSQRELELLKSEEVMPGVVDLITEAKTRGLRLGVASSSDRKWVIGHLKQLGLHTYFESIRCADDVERTKPSPDLYLAVLRDMGLRPDQAIAFEDSLHGVNAVQQAGIFCVAVPNNVTRHLPMPEADLTVNSLLEMKLEEYLQIAQREPQ